MAIAVLPARWLSERFACPAGRTNSKSDSHHQVPQVTRSVACSRSGLAAAYISWPSMKKVKPLGLGALPDAENHGWSAPT